MRQKTKKPHKVWKPQIKWSFFGLLTGIVLATVGSVAALNGWFGGGGSIPSDTLTRGLVGYWAMDEGTSTIAYDSSNYSHNATTSGTAPAWAEGKVGGALNFDGTDDLLDVRDSDALDITSAITIEAWAKDPPQKVTDSAKQVKDEHTKKLIRDQGMDPDYVGLVKDYGKRSEGKSPYARTYKDNQSGQYIMEVQGLPMVDADGIVVSPRWEQVGQNFKEKSNLFSIVVKKDGQTTIKVKNDQPDGRKKGDQLTFRPRLFIDDVEQAAGDPVLLAIDPTNSNYENNVLEWNYGIVKRRLRLIEGSVLGSWIFSANPNGNARIVYSQAGDYGLKLGQYANGADEELVPASVFNSAVYPFEVSDSATYNPDADPENTSVDGTTQEDTDASWATIITAGGDSGGDASTVESPWIVFSAASTDIWDYIRRGIFLFDSSALPDSATINAATLSLYSVTKTDGLAITPDINVYSSAPASNTALAAGDYDSIGSTAFATTITYANWVNLAYNDFTLNGQGIATISLTGVSKFGTRNATYDTAGSPPTWSNYTWSGFQVYAAEQGTGFQPKLVVTYTPVNKTIVSKGYNAYALEMSNDGTSLLGYVNYSTTTAAVSSPTSWHHFVMTYNGSEQILYIDGNKSAASSTSGSISANSTNLKIGNNFSGPIDEVRIYNRALSAEEVRYHYNRGGPVAQWKFDEGEGRIAYDSAEASTTASLDGTLILAGSATSSAWVAGKYGSALSFDGVDDCVDFGDVLDVERTDRVSFNFWLKPLASSNFIIAKDDYDNNDRGYRVDLSAGKIFFQLVNSLNSNRIQVQGFSVLSLGAWSHVVVTYDGSSDASGVMIYINGVQDSITVLNNNLSATTVNSKKFQIGCLQGYSLEELNGLIDDVRIYNYIRTPEEIRLDYNAGFAALFGPKSDCNRDPGSCMTQGLVGYWAADEGSGSVAYDGSPTATNHGTLASGPRWTKGRVGGALSFDGSDDQVETPEGSDSAFDLINALTYEVWVNPTDGGDTYGRFISKTSASPYSSRTTMLGKEADDETNVRWEHTGLTPTVLNSGANKMTVGVWNHVVGTYNVNGPIRKIYVNGVEVASDSPTGSITSSAGGALWLGTLFTTNQNFLGAIDEVKVYNRALSAEEVRYHYNKGGPVAYWKFDEGEGRIAYDSAEASTTASLDGTLVLAGSATSSAWVAGKYGSAISFDGVDDYVDVTSAPSFSESNSFTYAMWIKTTDTTRSILIGDWDSGPAINFEIHDSVTGVLRAYLDSNGETKDYRGQTNVANGAWRHVAFTYNASGQILNIYVDGIAEALTKSTDQTLSGSMDNAGTLKIGKDNRSGSHFYAGLIDDVRIYNYARTPEEIRLDYNAGFAALFGPKSDCNRDPGSCMTDGLVGYWNMEEGSGTIIYDSSNYAKQGSFTSSPRWGGPVGTNCKKGGCLGFDGTDDYVSVGALSGIDTTQGFSAEVWVNAKRFYNPNSNCGVKGSYIISQGPNVFNRWFIDTADGSGFRFGVRATSIVSVSTGASSTDQWHHLAGVYNKYEDLIKFYKDGVLAGAGNTSSLALTDWSSGTFNIGWDQWSCSNHYFQGAIDEVKVYNRALSAEEVRYHYNKGGPVAYWKFDEGEGRIAYDSAEASTTASLDGTLVLAGSATSSAWVAGKYGSAISFDGVNDYVNLGRGTFNGIVNNYTYEAWAKAASFSGSGSVPGVTGLVLVGHGSRSLLFIDSTGKPGFHTFSSSANYAFTGNITLNTGSWYHIAVVKSSGGGASIYVNGILDSNNSSAPFKADMQPYAGDDASIGKSGWDGANAGNFFNGLIDDVRIYNYVRTPEQILQDYNSGFSARFK